MLPMTLEELESVRKNCRKLVTRRAAISGAASVVPIPGVDIAADVSLLANLLPEINERFGLSPAQMEEYNPQMKMLVANGILQIGSRAAGKWITKELVIQLLKKVGVRITAKQAAKYLPLIGQATAAALGFGAMKIVGNQMVDDCYRIVKNTIEESGKLPPPDDRSAPPSLPS